MAFVFTIVGLLMIVTGVKGTYQQFGAQVVSDFTGSQPFTYWVAAIIAVGALGYVESLRTVSRLFLALIIVSMVLANRGFFAQLTAALKQGPVAPQGSGAPASSGASASPGAAFTGGGPQGTTTLKQSLQQPGGGGFWSYFNIPSWATPSWAQQPTQ
ncbi:MAG: hypothetical protein KGJ13_06680 [Patescibacteria group bacterium]|nr:hypothetical protein [Patescibacteria group bacterium]